MITLVCVYFFGLTIQDLLTGRLMEDIYMDIYVPRSFIAWNVEIRLEVRRIPPIERGNLS